MRYANIWKNEGGKVSIDMVPASDGRYIFKDNANYIFIEVTDSVVSSLLMAER